jgi:hypothetical protein
MMVEQPHNVLAAAAVVAGTNPAAVVNGSSKDVAPQLVTPIRNDNSNPQEYPIEVLAQEAKQILQQKHDIIKENQHQMNGIENHAEDTTTAKAGITTAGQQEASMMTTNINATPTSVDNKDARKLFVGGLPMDGEFIKRSNWFGGVSGTS